MGPQESTHMYRRRVNRVIDHIKDHLTEPLPIAKLARLAHFSPFHFHRIFRSIVRCAGDIYKEERAWRYLFHAWLPGSGYQPADDPMMEVYRRHPLDIGWETFDIDCCLPVRPLRRR